MSRYEDRKSEGKRRNRGVDTSRVQKPTSPSTHMEKLVEFAEAVVILRLLLAILEALNL